MAIAILKQVVCLWNMCFDTFKGRTTAIVRGEFASKSWRMWCSNRWTGISLSALVIPISLQKLLMATGFTPLLLNPERVYSRGSSHPRTCFPSTSAFSLRLERTLCVIFKRAYSNTTGLYRPKTSRSLGAHGSVTQNLKEGKLETVLGFDYIPETKSTIQHLLYVTGGSQ